MGGGKGGGSTTTSTSSNTPPPEVMAQYQNLIGQANAQAAQPLQQYQGNIVAPLSSYQNQAGQEVANLQGTSQPLYNQAQGLIQSASQQITPQTVNAADIQQYQNPYTQQVINSTMANINQQNQGQQQQLIGNAAQQGAWGGDRSAVAQSLLANQQDLANNQTIAGLENQGYSQALGEANTQQQAALSAQEASQYLGQQGGTALTNLGNTELNAGLAGASALNSAGAQQQAETQAQLNVPYEQFQQQQAFPYQNLSWLSSLSTGLGSNMGGTSTSSTTQPAPNSIFGFARGGHIDGLIKRLASGGATMMPAHYDSGGFIPGQGFDVTQQPGGIPNLDPNIFANDPMTLTRGNGLPGIQKATPQQQPSAMQQASQAVGLAGGINNLIPASSANPLQNLATQDFNGGNAVASLPFSSSSNFAAANAADATASDFAAPASSAGASAFFSNIGDALMAMFAKGGAVNGGLIRHYDDGGLVPFDTSTNPMANNVTSQFASMPIQQLQQMMPRIQNPQMKMMAQKVLQQKQMMPNAGAVNNAPPMAPSAPQAGMARGGLIKGYAFGGNVLPDILSAVGDVAGAFFGDPMAGSQATQALSQVDGGATKPGLQLSSIMNRGGLVKHYDDGGDVTPIPDNMPALTGQSAAPDNLPAIASQPLPATPISSPVHLSSDDADVSVPAKGLAQTNGQPNGGFTPIAMPTFHDDKPINDVSPWLSVAAGVAGALSGKSPYILQNLAGGALAGLESYGAQKKEAADETYKSASVQDARDQLLREAQEYNATGQQKATEFQQQQELEAKKEAATEVYQKGELANMAAERQKPIPDGFGGFIIPNPKDPANPIQVGMGGVGGGAGNASNVSLANVWTPPLDKDGKPLTGDAYYATVPPMVAGLAKEIQVGNKAPPTGFASKPVLLAAERAAQNADLSYVGTRFSTLQDFTKGPQTAKTIQSQNAVMEHIPVLQASVTALNNGDIPLFNKLSQEVARQTGNQVPTNYEMGKTIVGDEIAKAVLGANSAQADRDAFAKNLNLGSSNSQAMGQLNEAGKYMAGQAYALETRYKAGANLNDYRTRFMSPAARNLMEKYYPSTDDGQPTQVQPTASAQPKTVNWVVQDGKLVQSP